MSDERDDRDSSDQNREDRDRDDWKRRRRIAEVFGEVLPESTSDDRDREKSRRDDDDPGEKWLKAQVPPHHG